MAESGRFTITLTPEEKEALKKKAEAQSRTLSNLAAFIIKEWLAQNPD